MKLEVLELMLMAKKGFHALKIAWESEGKTVDETVTLGEQEPFVLQDGRPPPWTGLKSLMRVKYVPKRKSVAAYYDEFQDLILKLEYTDNEEHVVIRFKVGLNKEISSKMTIHKLT
ncbi:hypothetical protein KY290_021221 [Solanum tuberosum]|uniref:Retrotransposon gag domain-containing protein n=1 Tax=Solanum tuberosum TaxID=4113 RepID=A0ABQ7V0V5_SOLTU|nr:hypothetical protein KY290_021221 [Solanum tuberosum]